MTAKQEFLTLLDLMNEDDIKYALELLKDNFALRRRAANWDDIEEIEPDESDYILITKIENKLDGYGEHTSQEQLLEKLGFRASFSEYFKEEQGNDESR
jgi:Cu2+-containing amine oxidase